LPPPPRSTLFPYTTLFRSQVMADPAWSQIPTSKAPTAKSTRTFHKTRKACSTFSNNFHFPEEYRATLRQKLPAPSTKVENSVIRSEEHTSELQSQSNLVCR